MEFVSWWSRFAVLSSNCPGPISGCLPVVSFQVQSVVMFGLSGGCVQVLNYNGPASDFRQDGNSIGQDGKCGRQAVETHDRMVFKCLESDTDSEWVIEVSNIFDI